MKSFLFLLFIFLVIPVFPHDYYGQARQDFLRAMQLNSSKYEVFYLIGNTFFHERKYKDALSFYEQYLSIDAEYENVWFNATMASLSLNESDKACSYLQKASKLGMTQADALLEKQCDSQ